MAKRGRMSLNDFETTSAVNVTGAPDRLTPPDHLGKDERQRFRKLVATCDPRQFRPSDLSLLCRFVEADALAERAAKELREHGAVTADGKASPWVTVSEKCVRALVALRMRLRLSPQSRADPKTVARQLPPATNRPWE